MASYKYKPRKKKEFVTSTKRRKQMRDYYKSNKSKILAQQKQYRKSARGKLVLKARYEAIKMGKGGSSGGKKGGDSPRKKLNAANKALAKDTVKTMMDNAKKINKKKSDAGKGKGKGITLKSDIQKPNIKASEPKPKESPKPKGDKKKMAKPKPKGERRGIRLNPNIG